MSTTQWILLSIVLVLALLIGGAIITRYLVLRGLRTPWVLRILNRLGERLVTLVKRPLTVVVLDEVADVIQTGHYTRNISDAILENRQQLKLMVAEKVREDPNARLVNKLPGYDKIVDEVSESTLRVIVEVLADPRMDEFISDLLRNNLQQIKRAVRDRDHENVGDHAPADPFGPFDRAPRI